MIEFKINKSWIVLINFLRVKFNDITYAATKPTNALKYLKIILKSKSEIEKILLKDVIVIINSISNNGRKKVILFKLLNLLKFNIITKNEVKNDKSRNPNLGPKTINNIIIKYFIS